MLKAHHGPLSSSFMILSIFGMIVSYFLWVYISVSWGFLILVVSIMMFIASFISAVRAPLMKELDIEFAVHERYKGGRYPDTDLHEGLVNPGATLNTPRRRMLNAASAAKPKKSSAKPAKGKATKKKASRRR